MQKKVAEKTAGTKNSKTAKIIKGDGKASTSAEKAGAAALTKKPGLKQPTAKDKAASKSASTKPAAKKLVKKTSAPAIKAKDP